MPPDLVSRYHCWNSVQPTPIFSHCSWKNAAQSTVAARKLRQNGLGIPVTCPGIPPRTLMPPAVVQNELDTGRHRTGRDGVARDIFNLSPRDNFRDGVSRLHRRSINHKHTLSAPRNINIYVSHMVPLNSMATKCCTRLYSPPILA